MSQNYIIVNGELYHHGVKGMKWGRRRYQNEDGSLTPAGQKRYDKAANRIQELENSRKRNLSDYEKRDREAVDKYFGRNEKALKLVKAQNKADYDTQEVVDKYLIAKQKAKQDPDYKKTDEYLKISGQYGKMQSQMFMYGPDGHKTIETLKNQGYSEKKAKTQTFVAQTLGLIGGMAILAAGQYMINKYA